ARRLTVNLSRLMDSNGQNRTGAMGARGWPEICRSSDWLISGRQRAGCLIAEPDEPTVVAGKGSDQPGGGWISKFADSLTIGILWPLVYLLSLAALAIMWLMSGLQQIFYTIEIAVGSSGIVALTGATIGATAMRGCRWRNPSSRIGLTRSSGTH